MCYHLSFLKQYSRSTPAQRQRTLQNNHIQKWTISAILCRNPNSWFPALFLHFHHYRENNQTRTFPSILPEEAKFKFNHRKPLDTILVYSVRSLDYSPVCFRSNLFPMQTSSVTSTVTEQFWNIHHTALFQWSWVHPSPYNSLQAKTGSLRAWSITTTHNGETKWKMTTKALTPITGTTGQKHSLPASAGKALVMHKGQWSLSLCNILLNFTSSKEFLCQLSRWVTQTQN